MKRFAIHQDGDARITDAGPSTVNRTIANSTDKELCDLWDHMEDIKTIRDYRRKKKRTVIRDDDDGNDEEFLSEIFGQPAPEPPGNGYHVV